MLRDFLKQWPASRWRHSVYGTLVMLVLALMALYSVSRVGFYLFNTSFFPDMTLSRMLTIMRGGLRFDLAAVLYSNVLVVLLLILPLNLRFRPGYQTLVKWIFIIVNSIMLAINTADFIYYRFTLRRTTLSALDQFENEQNLGLLFGRFLIDYWYAVFFWLLLVVVLVVIGRLIRLETPQGRSKWITYGGGLVLMLVSIALFVGGVRGGFANSTRPITISNAAAYATEPQDVHLVLNTPFAVMRTARANVIRKVEYFSTEEELNRVFNPVVVPTDTAAFRPMNVVVIILESFSKEFVGAFNRDGSIQDYQGHTPFLDSLISVSRAYQYSMANGRKSIDAMPSVLASIPSIEVPFVLSHYSNNPVNGMAALLRRKGYYTAFFHGAPNGSMGFDAFANMSGFNEYFGKDEYGNDDDFDGYWGIWDHKFLGYFAEQMNSFPQPFMTSVFTTSSHHPYIIPEEMEGEFEEGPKPIYKTLRYADHALKLFFDKASKMPWFANTLFVITADHASAEIMYESYNTAWGYFAIPVFSITPGGLIPACA
ncbi:MAG: LTA synthase family protein [Cyclobacteriaceae bacterium]